MNLRDGILENDEREREVVQVMSKGRAILNIKGLCAWRIFELLRLSEQGKVRNTDVNCHGAAYHVCTGGELGWLLDPPTLGSVLRVEEALEEFKPPFGMQLHDWSEKPIHSAVILGRDVRGVPLAFHKPGELPFEICTYEEVQDQYHHYHMGNTFFQKWPEHVRNFWRRVQRNIEELSHA